MVDVVVASPGEDQLFSLEGEVISCFFPAIVFSVTIGQ